MIRHIYLLLFISTPQKNAADTEIVTAIVWEKKHIELLLIFSLVLFT